MTATLDYLHNKRWVWRANQSKTTVASTTGFAELDAQIGGGLPESGVVDLHSPLGIGELRLLLPYIKARQDGRLWVLINPPWQVNGEMLVDYGLSLEQILLITPNTPAENLWAAEQCLKSGLCHTLLLWQAQLTVAQVKRLQLAAERNQALQICLRPAVQSSIGLPVNLALSLAPHAQGLNIQVRKRKGGWPSAPFTVNMAKQWPRLSLSNNNYKDNIVSLSAARAS